MLRKILLVIFLFIPALAIFAQGETTLTYSSEDGAIEFSYSRGWTLEERSSEFNASYQFNLITSNYYTAISTQDFSYISLELINTEATAYPQTFETSYDIAEYAIERENLVDAQIRDTESTNEEFVRSEGIKDERTIVLYTTLREDNWALIASVDVPIEPSPRENNTIKFGEVALWTILDSLKFDAIAAATPFERNLEVYNTSGITLDKTYLSDNGILELSYPTDWELDDIKSGASINEIENYGYIFVFETPDEDINTFANYVEL